MFTFDSIVRYSETDYRGKLNIYGMLNYFQDCSTLQSESLGVGVEALHEKNLVWVLSTWQIDVLRYPKLGEKIVIGTFPYEYKGFFAKRNFIMKTADGEVLAMADTLWTLLNYKESKPARITPDVVQGFVLEEKLDMECIKGRIVIPEDIETKEKLIVSQAHIDANMHVNNGQYVKMVFDKLPIEDYKRLRVEYRNMARLDEEVSVCYKQTDRSVVGLIKDSEGNSCAVMEFSR